jgi:hypothetical protein
MCACIVAGGKNYLRGLRKKGVGEQGAREMRVLIITHNTRQ